VNNPEQIRLMRIVEFGCDLAMKASLMELRVQETFVHKIYDCTLVECDFTQQYLGKVDKE
jgi:hypothetical protein